MRRICNSCIQETELNSRQAAWVSTHGIANLEQQKFHKGIGCPHCSYTGYAGRIGVYELLEFDQGLTDVLAHTDSAGFTRAARNLPGYVSLDSVALQDAVNGITSIDEVLRISADIEAFSDENISEAEGQQTDQMVG